MKNDTNLSKIMHNAWNYVKNQSMNISNALKKAWAEFKKVVKTKKLQKRFNILYNYYKLNPKSLMISWELSKILWHTKYTDSEVFYQTLNMVKKELVKNPFIEDYLLPFYIKYNFIKPKK